MHKKDYAPHYHIDYQTITDTIEIWAYFAPLIFKTTFAGTHATVKQQRLIILLHGSRQRRTEKNLPPSPITDIVGQNNSL